jgi:DNA repair exonuclease SbcCD ATPase subunit
MNHEQRLDRLERILKLFVRAGVRYRRDMRELGDKLNIVVNSQIKNEDRFKQNEAAFQSRSAEYEKRFNKNEERFNRNEEKLAKLSQKTDQKFAELAESQARTDRSLAELIKIVTRGRNGNPQTDS